MSATGEQGTAESAGPYLSGDGRYAVFGSFAPNLVPGDTNGATDAFVHDRRTGTEEQANVTPDGKPAQRYGLDPSLSADGRSLAFTYGGDDLVPNGAAVNTATYVRDMRKDTTRGIVHDGAGGPGVIGAPRISRDGRCVAYSFQAPQGRENVYVRDLRTGASRLAGEAVAGGPVTDDGVHVTSFGGGGALLGLGSGSAQLVSGDTNGVSDGFVRHLR